MMKHLEQEIKLKGSCQSIILFFSLCVCVSVFWWGVMFYIVSYQQINS